MNEQEFLEELEAFDIDKILSQYYWVNLVDQSNGEVNTWLDDELECLLHLIREYKKR